MHVPTEKATVRMNILENHHARHIDLEQNILNPDLPMPAIAWRRERHVLAQTINTYQGVYRLGVKYIEAPTCQCQQLVRGNENRNASPKT